MPDSGYPAVELLGDGSKNDRHAKAKRLVERARIAMEHGLFIEWLESFVGAWNATKDVDIASWSGLEEWDM